MQSGPKPLQITFSRESYSYFDLDISPEEQIALDSFYIEKTSSYFRESETLDNLLDEVADFISQAGHNDSQVRIVIAELIVKQITRVLHYFEKETGQIIIRTFIENNKYDIPRWHIDGEYFPLSMKRMCKTDKIIILSEEILATTFDPQAIIITKINGQFNTHENFNERHMCQHMCQMCIVNSRSNIFQSFAEPIYPHRIRTYLYV